MFGKVRGKILARLRRSKMDPGLARFLDNIKAQPEYTISFLVTLELNKIEAKYQKQDEPRIFRRIVDEIGIVLRYEMNPLYSGHVPQPKTSFSQEEMNVVAETFGPSRVDDLTVMLTVGTIEHAIFESLTEEELATIPPPVWKTFDEHGFPTAFTIHPLFRVYVK